MDPTPWRRIGQIAWVATFDPCSEKEDFETVASGKKVVEHPDVEEIVWFDDTSVACRRCNCRQGPSTALMKETRSALFIPDAA